MATKTENIAVANAISNQEDKAQIENLMVYRTSLALIKSLADDGVFNSTEFKKICTILTKKHGLSSDSIFAEVA